MRSNKQNQHTNYVHFKFNNWQISMNICSTQLSIFFVHSNSPFIMKGRKLTLTFSVIRIIVYIAIFVAFSMIYLKNYLSIYLEYSTTYNSKHVVVEKLEYPTLIICVRDGYKPNQMINHDLNSIYDIYNVDYKTINLTVNELIKMLSYHEGIDYNIKLKSAIQFTIETILTFGHGVCQKLQPMEELDVYQRVSIDLKWNLKNEPAKEFIIYLVSNDSWHGICDETLPYFQPSKIYVNLANPQRLQVPISTTIYEYMNGNDFEKCAKDVIYGLNCSVKCPPFYLYSTLSLPHCNTLEDNLCVERELYFSTMEKARQIYSCHKPKVAKLFNPRPNAWKNHLGTNKSKIYFYFESLFILHQQETEVISMAELIGTIGGSLGLFTGFSFYSYFSGLLEIIMHKL